MIEKQPNNNMKHPTLIATLKTILVGALLLVANAASAGPALERARQISREAGQRVENIKENIDGLNVDSIAETVIYETAEQETADAADRDTGGLDATEMAGVGMVQIVSIVAIVFGTVTPFAALVLIVISIVKSKTQRKKMKYDTINNAIAAGCPLPDSFYLSETPVVKNRLQSGIVWLGWGMAFIVLGLDNDWTLMVSIGIIPVFIGLSRIAVYFVDFKRASKAEATRNAEQD